MKSGTANRTATHPTARPGSTSFVSRWPVYAGPVPATSAVLSRAAFGIDIQLAFGAGNVVIGDAVEIEPDIELVTDEVREA